MTGLLDGIRVVDLGGANVALAGRILADMGAEVLLVEPPSGGPGRQVPPMVRTARGDAISPHFLATAAGKRSVTAAVDDPAGQSLVRRLLASADVVLVCDGDELEHAAGLDLRSLRSTIPSLVVTSVTPFGRRGPRHRWRGSDLTAWAMSGGMASVGEADRPPLAPGGHLAGAAANLNAVAGTTIALLAQRRTGRGQLVDISAQEAVLSVTGETGPFFALEGVVGAPPVRVGRRRGPAQGMFPARDGMVEILPFMPGQWDALARWIADDLGIEEATSEVFQGPVQVRAPYAELLDGWVEALTSRYTKQAFLVEAQRRAIPCGAVNEPTDLVSDPHLAAVGAWVGVGLPEGSSQVLPGPPLRVDGERLPVGDVPAVGSHSQLVWSALGLTDAELDEYRRSGVI